MSNNETSTSSISKKSSKDKKIEKRITIEEQKRLEILRKQDQLTQGYDEDSLSDFHENDEIDITERSQLRVLQDQYTQLQRQMSLISSSTKSTSSVVKAVYIDTEAISYLTWTSFKHNNKLLGCRTVLDASSYLTETFLLKIKPSAIAYAIQQADTSTNMMLWSLDTFYKFMENVYDTGLKDETERKMALDYRPVITSIQKIIKKLLSSSWPSTTSIDHVCSKLNEINILIHSVEINRDLDIPKFKEELVKDIFTLLKSECEKINKGVDLGANANFMRKFVEDLSLEMEGNDKVMNEVTGEFYHPFETFQENFIKISVRLIEKVKKFEKDTGMKIVFNSSELKEREKDKPIREDRLIQNSKRKREKENSHKERTVKGKNLSGDKPRENIPCIFCGSKHYISDNKICLYETSNHPDVNRKPNISFLESTVGKEYARLGKDRISFHYEYDSKTKKLIQKKKKVIVNLCNIHHIDKYESNKCLTPIYFNREKNEVKLDALVDTGAIASSFISYSKAVQLEELGFKMDSVNTSVGTGIVGLNTDINFRFNNLDCFCYNSVTKQRLKIKLKNVFVVESLRYDLIIGRPDICKYNLFNILKEDICRGCEVASEKHNSINYRNSDNFISDIKMLNSLGLIDDKHEENKHPYRSWNSEVEVHIYKEDERLKLLKEMDEEWVNSFTKKISKLEESLSNLQEVSMNLNKKIDKKIDRFILPNGKEVVNGDLIHVDELFHPLPDNKEYNLYDLKESWRDSLTLSELELQDKELSIRNELIENEPEEFKEILGKITFGGDRSLQRQLIDLCKEYIDLFAAKLSDKPAKVEPLVLEVNVEKWYQPANCGATRVQSSAKTKEAEQQIKDKLNAGIIRKSTAQAWSQIHLVSKADGGWRLTIDYRNLNACLKEHTFPLPMIQHIIRQIGAERPELFAIMDLTEGFFQLPVSAESMKFTSFMAQSGQYEFCTTPMGIKSSGAWFQRQIQTTVLSGLIDKICKAYQDDIATYSKTKEGLIANLRQIFDRFREFGIKLSPKKARFGTSEEKLLGYVINKNGYRFDKKKLQGVWDFERPKTWKLLQCFLGLANHFRSHVKNMSDLARPLYNLMTEFKGANKKNLYWSDKANEEFEAIKKAIWECPTLFFHDDHSPIYLDTDASDYGIGAYLFQLVDGWEKVIALYSRGLRGHELNWSVFEKEAFSIYMAIRKFYYLIGDVPFILRTDHRNLIYMNNDASKKVIGWKMSVQPQLTYIQHREGRLMHVPDAQSRLVKDQREMQEEIMSMHTRYNDEANQLFGNIDNEEMDLVLNSLTLEHHQDEKSVAAGKNDSPSYSISALYTKDDSDVLQKDDVILSALHSGNVTKKTAEAYLSVRRLSDERYSLIKKYHGLHSGHLSNEATVAKIVENEGMLPGLAKDVAAFRLQCESCQLLATNKIPLKLHPFNVNSNVHGPMERIYADTIGPLPDSGKCKYILVIIDAFSRFITLYALEGTSAREAIEALIDHFGTFGKPLELYTDNGPQFRNDLHELVLNFLGMDNIKIMPYDHESNGIVERANREVLKHLKHIIYDTYIKQNWRIYLPLVKRIMNSTIHGSTGFAPSKIIFGANIDLDRGLFHNNIKGISQESMSQYLIDMLRAQTVILNKVSEFQLNVQKKYVERKSKEIESGRHINHHFLEGDYVLVQHYKDGQNPGRGEDKLSFKHKGPFMVINHRDDDIIEVLNLIDNKLESFHASLISPYRFDSNRILPLDVARKSLSQVEYMVDEVLEHFPKKITNSTPRSGIRFKIRWENETEENDSWEPWSNLRLVLKVHQYLIENNLEFLIPNSAQGVVKGNKEKVHNKSKFGRNQKRKNLD